jgi:hypothetical protein
MDMMPMKPERKAQLEGQQDYREAMEGIQRGYEDMNAGRAQPMEEFFEDLRVEHGFPR